MKKRGANSWIKQTKLKHGIKYETSGGLFATLEVQKKLMETGYTVYYFYRLQVYGYYISFSSILNVSICCISN